MLFNEGVLVRRILFGADGGGRGVGGGDVGVCGEAAKN